MQATWYDLVSILPGDVVSEGSVAGYQQPITPSGTNMFSCRLSHTLIHTKYTKRSGKKIEIYLLILFYFQDFQSFHRAFFAGSPSQTHRALRTTCGHPETAMAVRRLET
jgi:hypothetical protein